jgi:FkbM family methyltransferase
VFKKLDRIANLLTSADGKLDRLLAQGGRAPTAGHRFVELNGLYFKVPNHWFWDRWEPMQWEPQTYEIFKRHLCAHRPYIDLGAWVGPTVLYACELGARDIYALEANPLSFEILDWICGQNRLLRDRVRAFNLCVTDCHGGRVRFGGKEGADTSSASSIRGSDWEIPSATLTGFLDDHGIAEPGLIKVDIEGAESLILPDLGLLAGRATAVFLSLHPPFWADRARTAAGLLAVCASYDVRDSQDRPLSLLRLETRMLSDDPRPPWGTEHGNFFEVLLLPKASRPLGAAVAAQP